MTVDLERDEARGPGTKRYRAPSTAKHARTSTGMRRGWDSNPRKPCGFSGFQDRRIRPLCHPSEAITTEVLHSEASVHRRNVAANVATRPGRHEPHDYPR